MTTLRRELRKKFENIVVDFLGESAAITDVTGDELLLSDEIERIVGELADAAIEVRGIASKIGVVNAIAAGLPVTDDMVRSESIRDIAPKMFEKALGFRGKPLPWWDGDKEWKALGEWVCDEYQRSKTSFGEYNIWRSDKYTSGKLPNTRIRTNPELFYDSWDMFMMSREAKAEEQTKSRNLND